MVQGVRFTPLGGLGPERVFAQRDSITVLVRSLDADGVGINPNVEAPEPVQIPESGDSEETDRGEPRETGGLAAFRERLANPPAARAETPPVPEAPSAEENPPVPETGNPVGVQNFGAENPPVPTVPTVNDSDENDRGSILSVLA